MSVESSTGRGSEHIKQTYSVLEVKGIVFGSKVGKYCEFATRVAFANSEVPLIQPMLHNYII